MSLLSLPPQQSQTQADFNLDAFLTGPNDDTTLRAPRRTLPAEWTTQSGVQLTWPHADTDWAPMLEEVEACYLRLAFEIASRETLIIATPEPEALAKRLAEQLPESAMKNIRIFSVPTDDTWARDHAFLTVAGPDGIELLDYRFNGWGGKFAATRDNAISRRLHEAGALRGTYVDHLDFELEGGSIESDGAGTILTTARCLLNPNRNPTYTREQIEARLHDDLGATRVLWLEHGELAGDDTDAHVDTLARLCPGNAIAYVAPPADTADEHYAPLAAMQEELRAFRTESGEPYRLIPLPMPAPIFDEDGERLPATYANFLIMNGAVLYPTYAQPTADEAARTALSRAFPQADLVGIDCRALIRQHGSLHCCTMQFPHGAIPTANR